MDSNTTQTVDIVTVEDGCYALVVVFSLFLFISIFVYVLNLIFDLDERKQQENEYEYVRYGTLGDDCENLEN